MKKIKIEEKLKIREDLDGYILYKPSTKELFTLNQMSFDILSICNGKNESEIVEKIGNKYNEIEKTLIEKDVKNFLEFLEKNKIIKYDKFKP